MSVAGGGNNQGGRTGGGRTLGTGGEPGTTTTTGGGGLRFVTDVNNTEEVQAAARAFFVSVGVNLTPPKALFFNDRAGILFVRATMQDLDLIESAIQVLCALPPQVNIRSKFVQVSQNDNKALGFDWYLGNFLMNNGAIGAQGGSAPSFLGEPSPANPQGVFPGSLIGGQNGAGTLLGPSDTDQLITSGLRNPATSLFTLTGILTDPQFRVVIKALEQRDGTDFLASTEVTVISGRQTQMKATDVKSVITYFDFSQQVGNYGTGGGTTGGY